MIYRPQFIGNKASIYIHNQSMKLFTSIYAFFILKYALTHAHCLTFFGVIIKHTTEGVHLLVYFLN
jgi:hypothetical protein